MALTEEDKAQLSPEEVEALEALEDDPEGELDPGDEEIDENDADENDADGDDGDGDDGDDDGEEAAGKADAPPADEPKPAAAPAEPLEAYVPQFTKADADALKTVKADMATLDEQVEEGDISFDDWRAKRAVLEEKKTELDVKRRTDEAEGARFATRAAAAWNSACESWFNAQKIDPKTLPQDALTAFDAVVRSVTGSDLGEGLSMEAQLDLARAIFEQRGGVWPSPAAKGGKPRRRTQETLIPPSLADLGTADGAGAGDGEFARLDRLLSTKPLEYEAAIMKLSPERREAYLQAR